MTFFPRSIARVLSVSLGLAGVPAQAASLLPGGDFETGTFFGWSSSGEQGGFAFVAAESTCFSANDTTGIQLAGNFAAAVRPGGEAAATSVGTVTSAPFTAGEGIAFIALSEQTGTGGVPSKFEVSILDTDGTELLTVPFNTSVAALSPGCPSESRTRAFSTHYFSTSRFRDQDVRVQFRAKPGTAGQGTFVLVDQVIKFETGESPIFRSQPVAVAGTSVTSNLGILMLDGSLSFDPDGQELLYEWFIDGETRPRRGERVCVPDLAPGTTTTVTLIVSDGYHASSDSMLLGVPEADIDGVVVAVDDFNRGDDDAARNTGRQLFDPECAEEDEGLLFPDDGGDNATNGGNGGDNGAGNGGDDDV